MGGVGIRLYAKERLRSDKLGEKEITEGAWRIPQGPLES